MSRYKRFFQLFNAARHAGVLQHDSHKEFLQDVAPRKVESLRQLNHQELLRIEQLIEELLDPTLASMQRQRRKVIAILAGRGMVTAKGKPDMQRIHAWVERYGYLHKAMNAYTIAELPKLVTQAEAVMASDLKALQRHA